MDSYYLIAYFIFGAGFYTGACLCGKHKFHHKEMDAILRGFALGFIFWPLAILTYPLWKGDHENGN